MAEQDLGDYLATEITKIRDKYQERLGEMEDALRVLEEGFDIEDAVYRVSLRSELPEEGDEDVDYSCRGLSKAIVNAEDSFMRKNSVSHVSAEYTVFVKIGQNEASVPLEYWQSYMKVNREK